MCIRDSCQHRAQERQHRPKERPKTANIGPKSAAAWPAPLPLSTFTAFLGMGDFICSAAFVHFYCLSELLLPLSICCLACSAAFVDLYCLSGHGRLCRLLLPLSTFTAFINFYCLCRLALPLSDFAVVVGYADFAYWMSQLADPINCSALQLDFRIPTNSVPV